MHLTFKKYSISLTPEQEKKFEIFLQMFLEKNSHVNLSAIRDETGVIEKHFVDSLMLSKFGKLSGKVADVGTGGGFPGIPLKIFFGDMLDITFIDSVGKKVHAAEEFCKKLELKNTHFFHSRSEDLAKNPEHSEKYDFVTTRSVAYLDELARFTAPLLKTGGYLIAYKLDNPEEFKKSETSLKKYHLEIEKIEKYDFADQKRVILFLRKV